MKKFSHFLVIVLLLLTGCGGGGGDANSGAADSNQADVTAEESPTEPPVTPTDMPEPTEGPALLTSADEMAGIWLGTLAGETGYVMYTADGRYTVALSQDTLATAPRVSGEYWFEEDQIHLRDLENAGHWIACDPETVGIYEVADLGDGQIAFQMVEDDCGDSGFTRGYLFANMAQEWIAEPVDVVAPQ
jgi:hypothetical protein